jgi:hypothetical protein
VQIISSSTRTVQVQNLVKQIENTMGVLQLGLQCVLVLSLSRERENSAQFIVLLLGKTIYTEGIIFVENSYVMLVKQQFENKLVR